MNKEDKVLLVIKYPDIRNRLRNYLREQGYSKIWGMASNLEAISEARFYQPNLTYVGSEYKDAKNIANAIKHRTSQNTVKIIDTEDFFKKITSLEETVLKEMLEKAETV